MKRQGLDLSRPLPGGTISGPRYESKGLTIRKSEVLDEVHWSTIILQGGAKGVFQFFTVGQGEPIPCFPPRCSKKARRHDEETTSYAWQDSKHNFFQGDAAIYRVDVDLALCGVVVQIVVAAKRVFNTPIRALPITLKYPILVGALDVVDVRLVVPKPLDIHSGKLQISVYLQATVSRSVT